MSGCKWILGGSEAALGQCDATPATDAHGRWCAWHVTCYGRRDFTDAHRGPNPPDTPTAGESGEAATGDSPSLVAADIAADYPWFMRVLASEFVDLDSRVEEARKALAEIEAGRNAIAALRMFRRDLLVKDRYTARLEAELVDAKQHEAHWRKEADSWKESVDNLTRQVDDLKEAIDTADTAVAAAFTILKGYAL